MNNCKVCGRESRAKGLCVNHYSQLLRYGKVASGKPQPHRIKNKKCSIGNCGKEHFAKEYCRKHYSKFITYSHSRHYHKCKVEECKNTCRLDYCGFHRYRLKNGLPLDNRKYSQKGERNVNWKGGVSDYPNHYLMKKNRLIILMQNPKCEICGNPAIQVHHRDGDKSNHELSNLMASCCRCNNRIRFRPNQSKYSKIYGMNFMEMARNFGYSNSYYHRLHKQGKLKEYLNVVKNGKVELPLNLRTPNPYKFKLYRFRKSYKLNVEKLSRTYKVPKEDIYLWIYNKVKIYDMKLEPLYREFIDKGELCPPAKA